MPQSAVEWNSVASVHCSVSV